METSERKTRKMEIVNDNKSKSSNNKALSFYSLLLFCRHQRNEMKRKTKNQYQHFINNIGTARSSLDGENKNKFKSLTHLACRALYFSRNKHFFLCFTIFSCQVTYQWEIRDCHTFLIRYTWFHSCIYLQAR